MIWQEEDCEKWKLKRQRGRNERIGMINSLKEMREKLKRPSKIMKRETMRTEEANTTLVGRNVQIVKMNWEWMAGNKIKTRELLDWTKIEMKIYNRKKKLFWIWKITSNRIWCYMRWYIEVVLLWIIFYNIIIINILMFICFNSQLKTGNSGIKIFRHSVILTCT